MNGALPLFPLSTFMALTGTPLPFNQGLLVDSTDGVSRLVGHEGTQNSILNGPSVAQPVVQDGFCNVPTHMRVMKPT
jgi:hypothetical protein